MENNKQPRNVKKINDDNNQKSKSQQTKHSYGLLSCYVMNSIKVT